MSHIVYLICAISTFTYAVHSDTLVLEARDLQVSAKQFWTKKSTIAYQKDLIGCQVFVYPNPMNEAIDKPLEATRFRIKNSIVLSRIELGIGKGKKVVFDPSKADIIKSDWNEKVYVFTIKKEDIQ